jgi:hypothetical protein
VSLGWFDRVTIASLLPGHTHEDIDMLFSMLWRRLKKPDGAATVLTWPEIIRSAQDVYCGWDQPPPAGSAAGRVQISEIGAVASFQQAFGLGRWAGKASPLRPVRNGAIKGLFGKGSDPEKKPHRFVIERGVNGPTVTAYFTAARDSPIFRTESPIFASCPDIVAIGSADVHGPLVAQLQKVSDCFEACSDTRKCGYTNAQVALYKSWAVSAAAAPPRPVPTFFSQRDIARAGLKWEPLQQLGPRQAKGQRAASQARLGDAADLRSDEEEEGEEADDWERVAAEQAKEKGKEEEDADDESDSLSDAPADDEEFVIEHLVSVVRFSRTYQLRIFLVKYEGYAAAEEIWESSIPRNLIESFDANVAREQELTRQARQKEVHRETRLQAEELEAAERSGKRRRSKKVN